MKQSYETERLLLLPAAQSQAQMVADYYCRNKAFFEPFDPAAGTELFYCGLSTQAPCSGRGKSRARRRLSFLHRAKGTAGADYRHGALNNVVWGSFCSCFLGYKLDKDWLRQGLMSEAVKECVRIAFEELGLHRIEANIMPHNIASLGVVRRCGFVEEGLARKYLKINGVWEDHLHMVKLNED